MQTASTLMGESVSNLRNVTEAQIGSTPYMALSQAQLNLKQLRKKEQKLKNTLELYKSLADSKLQALSYILSLMALVVIYIDRKDSKCCHFLQNVYFLGLISVAQMLLAYVLVIIFKCCLIPRKQTEVKRNSTEQFMLFDEVYKNKRQLKSFSFYQLKSILQTIKTKQKVFKLCFPKTNCQNMIKQISKLLMTPVEDGNLEQENEQLQKIIDKEANAKKWQNFFQVFILNKSFSVPYNILLALIPGIYQYYEYDNQFSQDYVKIVGWVCIGIWGIGILANFVIRVIFWGRLNRKVENSQSSAFLNYNLVYLNLKQLKSFNIDELESLEKILQSRTEEFQKCFKNNSGLAQLSASVKYLIGLKLPKKDEKFEKKIRKIVERQKSMKESKKNWQVFTNHHIILTIITSIQFLISMDHALDQKYLYKQNKIRSSIIGYVGIGFFVLGYTFYFISKCCLLNYLEKRSQQNKASPYLIYRLVFFGGKAIKDLQLHELEQIKNQMQKNPQKFQKVFIGIKLKQVSENIDEIINLKKSKHPKYYPAFQNLLKYNTAKTKLNSIVDSSNNPFFLMFYSIYLLLVFMVLLFFLPTQSYYIYYPQRGFRWVEKKYPRDYWILWLIGLLLAFALVITKLIISFYIIPYYKKEVKSLHISGWTQCDQVYNNRKDISKFSLAQLHQMEKIILENPLQFQKCFPKFNIELTLRKILDEIKNAQKRAQNTTKTAELEQRYQIACLELSRYTNSLKNWSSFVTQKLPLFAPIVLMFSLFYLTTIAEYFSADSYHQPHQLVDSDDFNVCIIITTSLLSLMLLIALFYGIFYHRYLCRKIQQSQDKVLRMERGVIISVL